MTTATTKGSLFRFLITGLLLSIILALALPIRPVSATVTTYQAENATIFHGVVESNHAGFTGTGFVNYNNEVGSYVEWLVSVPQAGTAKLTFRFANGTTTNRPMSISVNGAVVNSNLAFNGTGAWTTWSTQSLNASLNAGTNTIRATATTVNGGPNVDRLDVDDALIVTPTPTRTNTPTATRPPSNDGTPYPGGTPWAVPGTIQAEHFNNGGQGVAYNDTDATNNGGQLRPSEGVDIQATTDSGGGHNVGWTRAGEWLKYTVNVASSDSYTFNARVASAASGAAFHIEIDGTNVSGSLSVPNTGGTQTWTTISKSGINLSAGQHVVRVVFDTPGTGSTAVGNYNWFSFSSGSPPTLTPTPTIPTPIGNTPVEINGQLRVCGTKICNQFGKPIQLRGMSTHGLQWYGWGKCVTEGSLNALANDWKADIMRISLYVQEGGYETDPAGFRAQVDLIVNEMVERGMYALLDWHMLDPGDPMFNLTRAKEYFSYMAQKHGNKPNVLYEIANEPSGVSWARIKSYAEQVIPVIRQHDPDGIIIIGTRGWSSLGVSEGGNAAEIVNNPVSGSNLMYTFHFYAASHTTEYRNELAWAADRLPIFVTEWGTQEYTGDGPNDFTSSQAYIDLMRSKQISWTSWNYSDDQRSGAAFKVGTCPNGPWAGTSPLKTAGVWVRDKILNPPDNFPTN